MARKITIVILLIISSKFSNAQFGLFASAVYLNSNGTSAFYNNTSPGLGQDIGSLPFQGTNLGTFEQNAATLRLVGAEIKTYKGAFDNVCSGTLYFTVYPNGSRPISPVFTPVNLGFYSDCFTPACTTFYGSFTIASGGGCCSAGDQKWQNPGNGTAANIDLTAFTPGNYTLELYYEYSGQDGGNGCGTTKYDNNSNNPVNYTAGFTISTPVPVKFGDIHVNNARGMNTIYWNTYSEAGSSVFKVERSSNGGSFQSIGEIPAAGYSALPRYYSLQDADPANGINYYRIKMMETDGRFQYSAIAKTSNTRKNDWYVYFDPAAEMILINGISKDDDIRLLDVKGTLINKTRSAGNSVSINSAGIASGTYLISINQNGHVGSRQVIIIH